jgi:hypothetical protein
MALLVLILPQLVQAEMIFFCVKMAVPVNSVMFMQCQSLKLLKRMFYCTRQLGICIYDF